MDLIYYIKYIYIDEKKCFLFRKNRAILVEDWLLLM